MDSDSSKLWGKNKVEIKIIDEYKDFDFEFLGCDCFRSNNKALLLNRKNKTSMIVDISTADDVEAHKFNDALKLKFLKRGFARSKKFNNSVVSNIPKKGGYPSYFLIELTKKCNLHCKYCFKDLNSIKNQNKISLPQLTKICDYIINFCKDNNINNISFQPWGGEPLICLDEIIFAKQKLENANLKVFCSVQTNATLLSAQTVKLLKENRIKVGVSIDGFANIQNYQRPYANNLSTFEDVIVGINNLKNSRVNFGFLTVITNYNVDNIEKIIHCFVYNLGVHSFKFNIMRPNENATEDIGVPLYKISKFIETLFNTLVNLIENGVKVSDNNIKLKLKNITIRYSGNACKTMGCMGGISIISFDKEGNIYPCELTDHNDEIIGNIKDKISLPMLIENARNTKKYYQRRGINSCANCAFKGFCFGGCTAAVKYIAKSYNEIDRTECLINKTLYPKLIDLILTKPHVAEILMENKVMFV